MQDSSQLHDLTRYPLRWEHEEKARYYEDARFKERLLSPPSLAVPSRGRPDDWTTLPRPARPEPLASGAAPGAADEDPTESERRQQPAR